MMVVMRVMVMMRMMVVSVAKRASGCARVCHFLFHAFTGRFCLIMIDNESRREVREYFNLRFVLLLFIIFRHDFRQ